MPGTSDPALSLALALTPPGNLERSLSEIRRGFWVGGAASARAYFDEPVIAWLSAAPDEGTLSRLARRFGLRFELAGFCDRGGDTFLAFSPDASIAARAAIEELRSIGILAAGAPSSEPGAYVPGPFEPGLGCYCATASGRPGYRGDASTALRAKTCLLSLIELEWTPGDASASSWATLSSIRVASPTRRRNAV